MRTTLRFVTLALLAGCLDTSVPARPSPPGPGTLQGRVVFAEPGRPGVRPAPGAVLEVVGQSARALADGEGRFTLPGLLSARGNLLIAFAGPPARQRFLSLESLGAGRGVDRLVGDVSLRRNGSISGQLRRTGDPTTTGLGGTAVFLPGLPFATYTADDGSFRLENLPGGAFQLAAFAPGFEVVSTDVTVGDGEDVTIPPLQLVRAPVANGSVTGTLVRSSGAPATDSTARATRAGMERSLSIGAEGRFSDGALTAGVYTFRFERPGSIALTLYNVLIASQETDLGELVLNDGMAPPAPFMGLGAFIPGPGPDGGAPTDAGMVDAGEPPDAGFGDGGSVIDAGTDAGAGDAGGGDGGSLVDAGSGLDASVPDAGPPPPTAVASGPVFAAPGSSVQLSGMASQGLFPLVYRWTQTSGTPVTLTVNNTPLAHSPRFTAPAAGTVVIFELVVEDVRGVRSSPSVVGVPIGVRPLARFAPDAGLVSSGQTVELTSTSFDDAGVAIVAYDWQLLAGSPGTLTTDGGPVAFWRAPTTTVGNDLLAGLSLSVTNAIGLTSAQPALNFYTVRAPPPVNWGLDAGIAQVVNVGPVPPQVILNGSFSAPGVSNPQVSVSWACDAGVALIGPDQLAARFIAPRVNGPSVRLLCQLNAIGQPPLEPPTLSATTLVTLNDTNPPEVLWTSVTTTSTNRFGFVVQASEPLSSGSFTSTGWGLQSGSASKVVGSWIRAEQEYNSNDEGDVFGPVRVTLRDSANVPQVASSLPAGPPVNVVVQSTWAGPWQSTATFLDPRPVVATLGPLPRGQQEMFGVTPGSVAPWEVVATESGQLVRFADIDPRSTASCVPSCPGSSTVALSGLGRVESAVWGGAELFVSTLLDGGARISARRNAAGTWSVSSALTGFPVNWENDLRTVWTDGGTTWVDSFDPVSGAFITTDRVGAVADVAAASSIDDHVSFIAGPMRAVQVLRRNAAAQWNPVSFSIPLPGALSLQSVAFSSTGVNLTVAETVNGLSQVRHDSSVGGAIAIVGGGPLQGFDLASFGGAAYLVYSQNGDVRLRVARGSFFSGAGGGYIDFGGPPRFGSSPPFPVVLDVTTFCEAVYPRFAFVEDALIITWQERCAPETRWRVMARAIR